MKNKGLKMNIKLKLTSTKRTLATFEEKSIIWKCKFIKSLLKSTKALGKMLLW